MLTIKGTKLSGYVYIVAFIALAFSFVDYFTTGPENVAFIGAISGVVGGLAKGAVSLFSGKGKAARKAAKQAKSEAKEVQKAAERQAKAAEISAQTAKTQAKTQATNIMAVITKYWWVGAAALALFFVVPMLTGKKKGRR